MAYPSATDIILPGQRQLTGDDDSLLLTMFSGEVLNVFRDKLTMMNRHRVIPVGAGKDFQWPKIGQATTAYHTRGESLLDDTKGYLSDIEHTDTTITVDNILLSSIFLDNFQEMLRHFETRSEYSYQLGAALARKMDKHLFQLACASAQAGVSDFATPMNADKTKGARIAKSGVSGTDATSVGKLIDSMVDAASNFAQKDVPMDGLCFFVRPEQYYALQREGSLLDTNYGNAGNGSQASGSILRGYGFEIAWSNFIPSTDLSAAEPGVRNDYSGDFTQTVALAMHRDALGTVMRENVQTETDYQVERQGTLLVSKVTCGHGVLRPECLAVIEDSAI